MVKYIELCGALGEEIDGDFRKCCIGQRQYNLERNRCYCKIGKRSG